MSAVAVEPISYRLCNGRIVSSLTHTIEFGNAVYHIDTRVFLGHLVEEVATPPISRAQNG